MFQPLSGFMLLPNGLNIHTEQSPSRHHVLPLFASEEISSGDKGRASTGIRPSLHPTTINALAGAMKLEAEDDSPLKTSKEKEPICVAKIAADFLQARRDTSGDDDMEFEVKEEQTIAGRVVGVVKSWNPLYASARLKCPGYLNTRNGLVLEFWKTQGMIHWCKNG